MRVYPRLNALGSRAVPLAASLAVAGVIGSWAGLAQAQTTTATDAEGRAAAVALDREKLKEELRQELVEEIKAEIKADLAGEGVVPAAPAGGDAWAEEEWKWEEPVKPELNFLEFDGYFRFRYDLWKTLDLGLFQKDVAGNYSGAYPEGFSPNVPLCLISGGCQDADTLGGANMRLRLEPILNVSEDIKIKAQIDVLDNLVLGSTPDGFPKSFGVPVIGFSQNQGVPSDRVNALVDSIRVKRVWAEIMTPIGQLRVGRMGSQFGMGVLSNDGSGIDADYGDTNDRILFATKLAGHYIIPAFDWNVSGPTSANADAPGGQPFDRDQRDDVDQYILAVAKRDSEQEIKDKLENDQLVLNYGSYLVYRTQALDSADYYSNAPPASATGGPAAATQLRRDAELFIGSLWLKFLWRKLLLEGEAVGIYGNVRTLATGGLINEPASEVEVAQWGAALRGEYKLLHDALTIRLMVATASGDKQPGWGVYPLTAASPVPGQWDGAQQADGKINNFRFDPDFHVDTILWRQLVGTFTDGLVIRPGVQYNFTESIGARLDIVYSRAMWAGSTPSASYSYGDGDDAKDNQGNVIEVREPNANLGIEADAKLFYASVDGFHAWFEYAILFPFAGLDRRVNEVEQASGATGPSDLSSEIAQTLQVMFGVTF